MTKYKIGILGATGMVGQRFVELLSKHPWFEITVLAASARSAGKTYADAVKGWYLQGKMPHNLRGVIVKDVIADMDEICKRVDFCFCALNMDSAEIREIEEDYAKRECPVISNNSAHRFTPDVPMIIPEINPEHLEIIPAQRERLGTKRGFIAVKSNCSLQSYLPLLFPLKEFGLKKVAVTTYQAISGAGKTFDTMPEILDNIIPYIKGEEEKSEKEPLKILGKIENGQIVCANEPVITAQCLRVPVSDGHTAACFVSFEKKPTAEEIIERWVKFKGAPQELKLPTAPEKFIRFYEDPFRPQPKKERIIDGGMSIAVGRLRDDPVFDYKFIGCSHNTLRGAAGGAVLLAELLAAKGYFN